MPAVNTQLSFELLAAVPLNPLCPTHSAIKLIFHLETKMPEEEMQEIKSFKDLGLCNKLVDACNRLSWKTPTKIQAGAIPLALQGSDLIGVARKGSGKTGALVLSILNHALLGCHSTKEDESASALFALVLCPFRGVAYKVSDQFRALGSGLKLKFALVEGSLEQLERLISCGKWRPNIIVATPGPLVDLITNSTHFSLSMLKYLVLHEAFMFREEDIQKAFDILKLIPCNRQTYCFSSVKTSVSEKLQGAFLRNPAEIDLQPTTLKHQYTVVPTEYKEYRLVSILTEMSGCTSVVFTQTCAATRLLSYILRKFDIRAIHITTQMSGSKMIEALKKFLSREYNVLVCTDAILRALNKLNVDLVINYDVPPKCEYYMDQVGKAVFGLRSGATVSLVTKSELDSCLQMAKHTQEDLFTYPAQKEESAQMFEDVAEAKRQLLMEREKKGGSKKRKRLHRIKSYLGIEEGKPNKKVKRK